MLIELIERLREISDALLRDTNRCSAEFGRLPKNPSELERLEGQFWFRAYVRAFFAHVEGVSFAMRRLVLEYHEQFDLDLSVGEVVVLSELRYSYDSRGLRESPAFNKLETNLRLAFAYYPRLFGATCPLEVSDHKYSEFLKAIVIRDRLMHPKAPEDVSLSAAEIQSVASATRWFSDQMLALVPRMFEAIKRLA